MYNAEIKTIPHREQRYDTCGDWWKEAAWLKVRVSSMGNPDYEFLIAIHELVERQLCMKMGISEQTVDAWDLAHEDEEEPGAMESCPYREAHMRAEAIERVLANDLGVDWEHYSRTVTAIVKETPLPSDPTVHDKRPGEDYVSRSGEEYRQSVKTRTHTMYASGHQTPKMKPKQKARSVLRDR